MAASHSPAILHLPEEMLTLTFAQLEIKSLGPRLGRLCVPGRTAIATPHYIASASRGIVPHVSHDVLHKHTQIRATYNALEDCKFARATVQLPLLTPCSQTLYSHRENTTETADTPNTSPNR